MKQDLNHLKYLNLNTNYINIKFDKLYNFRLINLSNLRDENLVDEKFRNIWYNGNNLKNIYKNKKWFQILWIILEHCV